MRLFSRQEAVLRESKSRGSAEIQRGWYSDSPARQLSPRGARIERTLFGLVESRCLRDLSRRARPASASRAAAARRRRSRPWAQPPARVRRAQQRLVAAQGACMLAARSDGRATRRSWLLYVASSLTRAASSARALRSLSASPLAARAARARPRHVHFCTRCAGAGADVRLYDAALAQSAGGLRLNHAPHSCPSMNLALVRRKIRNAAAALAPALEHRSEP